MMRLFEDFSQPLKIVLPILGKRNETNKNVETLYPIKKVAFRSEKWETLLALIAYYKKS